MRIVHTHVGRVVLLNPRLTRLVDEKTPQKGSIALALLLDDGGRPAAFTLLWEWGGDWFGFCDMDQYDPDALAGWEPEEIRKAVAAAVNTVPACEEDMDWFLAWADAAESTLAAKRR